MTLCRIALGGNVGDVRATFATALAHLAGSDLTVTEVSRLYATPPMGADAGGPFLNAAATIETSLDPLSLLDRLHATEGMLGRVRTVHWGPRPIDLDLVLFGDEVIDVPRLRVPHSAAWYRRFVLDPLCDIAGKATHPETEETFAILRRRLLARPLAIAVRGPLAAAKTVAETLRHVSPEITVVPAGAAAALTLDVGAERGSAVERVIAVSADGSEAAATAAIVAAALGTPQPAGNVACPTEKRR